MLKPTPLPVQVVDIPDALKAQPRWCLWKYEQITRTNGEAVWTKIPVNPHTLGNALSNKAATWSTYEEAFDAYLGASGLAGIAFMLGDGWIGVDVDDCYDVLDGFSQLAEDVLASVPGYAEISPSGNGVKVITRGTIPQSKADHKQGLEVYDRLRFFAVTGHAVPGRVNTIPGRPVDLAPFYVRHFGAFAPSTADNADALANAKGPLTSWDIDRVRDELLGLLDPDCHYTEWLEVGAALHHQGEGDSEWCELWDAWSSNAPDRYTEGLTEEKWLTFSEQRAQGKGPITLATLIKRARSVQSQEKFARVEHWTNQITNTQDRLHLMEEIPRLIARDLLLDGVLREELAQLLQQRIKAVTKTRHPIATIRAWLTPVVEEAPTHAPDWVSEHVYVTDDDAFFSLATKTKLSRTAFNAIHNRYMPKDDEGRPIEKAADAATDRWDIRVVRRIAYHPLLPDLFDSGGDLNVNSYRADQVPGMPPVLLDEEEAAIARVRTHIANLFPDEREQALLLSWLAFVVQQPGVKVRWAPYICGPTGDGKSFFLTLLGCAMGQRNVRSLNGHVLESSPFSDWAVGHSVIGIEEMKLHGHNRFDAFNRLKPFITNEIIDVHPKGKPTHSAMNATQYIIFSNYLDGVPITDDDRRMMFLKTRFTKPELRTFKSDNPTYYRDLFETVQTYPGAMRYWLMNASEPHADFDPNGDAPITAMRSLVVDMSQSDTDIACQEAIREKGPGVTTSWVASAAFVDLALNKMGAQSAVSRQQMARIAASFLSSRGYVYMGGDRHRVGPNGIQSRIWRHESVTAPDGDWWTAVSPIIEKSYTDAVAQEFLA